MITKSSTPFATLTDATQLAKRSSRGAVITVASQALKFALNILSTTILARLLTPNDYGIVGMATTLTSFVALFKEMGLSSATVQRPSIRREEISTLLWINVGLSIVLAVITISLAPAIALFYDEPRLKFVTAWLALPFILQGFTVQNDALLRRQMRFAALAWIEVLSLLAAFVVAATLAYQGSGYWALVASSVTLGLVSVLGVWVACPWTPCAPTLSAEVKEMLRFGGNLTGFSTANYFARNSDNVLIGRFWGSQQLGLYNRAYQLLMLPINQLAAPLASVLVPLLSRLVDQPELYRKTYLRVVEKLALVTMPGMMFLVLTADWFIEVLMGPKWAAAAPLFAWLGLAGLLQPVANTTGWLFVSQGRTREMFRWGILGGGALVAFIVAGLPWGASGVATSYAIGSLLIFPILVWYVARSGPVDQRGLYRALALPCLASGVVAALVMALRGFVSAQTPVAGLLTTLLASCSGVLFLLVALPRGRAAIVDTMALLRPARATGTTIA